MTPTPLATARDPFEVIAAPGGVELHLQRTDKYKSVLLLWVVEAPLDERRAARALLPDLLTRGTARSPGLAAMAARCEELYAMDLLAEVSAHGRLQLLRFGFEAVADRYSGGRPLFMEAAELLAEVLHEPPLPGGRLRADFLEQERTNLVHAIAAMADDKALYSYRRLVETMHAGTPFALHPWGTVEQAAALDEPAVRAAWDEVRDELPVRLMIVGDVSREQALDACARLLAGTRHAPHAPAQLAPALPERPLRHVREVQPLAQSKLVMGFRVQPELLPGAAAPLFGLVFGGDSHSRLFKRVREAESLAYGCSAGVSIESATAVVQAGVDAVNAPRTQELVLDELRRLAEHGVREDELALSRRAQLRRLDNLKDSPRAACAFRLGALMSGRPHVLEEARERVQRVTPEQVAAVAAGCEADTVFLLEGKLP